MATQTKKQHYVPRLLLKNFCSPSGRIYAFDKQTQRSFSTSNLMNVAQENHFYEIKDEKGNTYCTEDIYADIEAKVAPVLNSIIQNESICHLRLEEKIIMANFIFAQHLRTKAYLECTKASQHNLLNWLLKIFIQLDPDNIIKDSGITKEHVLEQLNAEGISLNENWVKTLIVYLLGSDSRDSIIKRIIDMEWFLFKTDNSHFILSDNPVMMRSNNEESNRRGIGWMSPELNVFLPISNKLLLALFCPCYFEELYDCYIKLIITNPHTARQYWQSNALLTAKENKRNILSSSTLVRHFNRLQIGSSLRYLYSSSDDFLL